MKENRYSVLNRLNDFAAARGMTLSELALKWCLRDPRVTSVLIGASRVSQLEENLGFLTKADPDPSDWAELYRLAKEPPRGMTSVACTGNM